jgi:hypothetical protein
MYQYAFNNYNNIRPNGRTNFQEDFYIVHFFDAKSAYVVLKFRTAQLRTFDAEKCHIYKHDFKYLINYKDVKQLIKDNFLV